MSVIFTIIGFIVLGFIIRGFAKDKTLQEPKNNGGCIFQLIICLIIGAIVYSVIPKSCHSRDDYDATERGIIRR